MKPAFNILPAILRVNQTKDAMLRSALDPSGQCNAYLRESVEDASSAHAEALRYQHTAAEALINVPIEREIEIARQLGTRAWKAGHRQINATIDAEAAHLLDLIGCSAVALYAYACIIGGEYELVHRDTDGSEKTTMKVRVRPGEDDGLDHLDLTIRLDGWKKSAWWEGSFIRLEDASDVGGAFMGKDGDRMVDILPSSRHLFVEDLVYQGKSGDGRILRTSRPGTRRIVTCF